MIKKLIICYKKGKIYISKEIYFKSIIIFIFCDFVSMLIYSIFPYENIALLAIIKELYFMIIFIIVALFFLLMHKIKLKNKILFKNIFLLSIIIILFLIFELLLNKYTYASLYYFRQFIYFFVTIILFLIIDVKNIEYNDIYKFLKIVFIIILLFGVFEYLIDIDIIWNKIILFNSYMIAKGDMFITEDLESQGRFYSWDFINILGFKTRRMVSIFVDPIRLSTIVLLIFNIILFKKDKLMKDKLLLILSFIVGLMTFSKYFYINIILSIIYYIFTIKIKNMIIILTLLSFITIILIDNIYLNIIPSSAINHLNGLKNSILNFSFLGYGIGHGGNIGSLYFKKNIFGMESSLGCFISQFGIFSIMLINIFNYLYKMNYINKNKNRLGSLLIIQYYIGYLLSESFLSVTIILIYFSITINLLKMES